MQKQFYCLCYGKQVITEIVGEIGLSDSEVRKRMIPNLTAIVIIAQSNKLAPFEIEHIIKNYGEIIIHPIR